MFIISPKWIYFGNRKIESGKSLLIDGSVIAEILTDNNVLKKYSKIPRIHYKHHLMLPTFSEYYINMDDCTNHDIYSKKLTSLLKNGVTNVQVVSNNYKNFLKYDVPSNMNISYKIIIDASKYKYDDIRSILKTLDFYKSDHTKRFNVDIKNICNFKNDVLIKIASICNELNLSIDIHLGELANLANKKINDLFKFWEEINLTNNYAVHDFLQCEKIVQKNVDKVNTTLIIRYSDLFDINNLVLFFSLIKKKYKCVLASDLDNTFRLYDLLKGINLFFKNNITFDEYNIMKSFTSYSYHFSKEASLSTSISNGGLASFNIYDIQKKRLLLKDNFFPQLSDFDNTSLTSVWSSGEAIDIKDE